MNNEEGLLDQVELNDCEEINDDEVNKEDDRPDIGSKEWSDFVLSQLTKNEKFNDNPKTEGLIRIARSTFGDYDTGIKVHHVSPEYAAVTCHIVSPDGTQYVGSAEVVSTGDNKNCDEPYSKYPLATAETRAIGRAVKRMLCLTNVLTAEEGSVAANLTIPSNDENRTEGSITKTQINFIDKMCSKLDISVIDSVKNIVGDHKKINDLSHAEALRVNENLDSWSKDKELIPALGAYSSGWKTDFYKN